VEMPKTNQCAKELTSETNFWGLNENCEQPTAEILHQSVTPISVLLELPRNWWSSHASIGSDNKLRKVDLVRINQERLDKRNLPVRENWDVSDGDYLHDMTDNEEEQVSYLQIRKSLEKKIFGAVLIFVALIILLVSFVASMI